MIVEEEGRIAIAGGGIAGLAAAIALGRSTPHAIDVYERSLDGERQGAALLLWSSATRTLESLGLGGEIASASSPVTLTEIRASGGDLLSTLPIEEWAREDGASTKTVVIRRPVLLEILRRALPGSVRFRSGVSLVSFAVKANGTKSRVRLELSDGTTDEADALVGADGLHSNVRRKLLGDEPLRIAGYDAWIGIVPVAPSGLRPGVATASLGEGPRFWSAMLPDGAVFWYATISGRERAPRDFDALRACFRGWHAPIGDLLDATDEGELFRTTIRDRLPAMKWGSGPVTLVGDAAHPSTPDLGLGACQAIESAASLGEHAHRLRLEEAFRAYERERMPRTAAITKLCWMTGANSTTSGAVACRVRNAAIRFALAPAARSSLRWLAGERA